MTTSLYLRPDTWDLVADVNGNIAVCSTPYAEAQDAACAIKCWLGELIYDTTQGVPWKNILGELPPIGYVRAQLVTAALTVLPTGSTAKVLFSSFTQRALSGQVQITLPDGQTAAASF
jgi:hypothetical protein